MTNPRIPLENAIEGKRMKTDIAIAIAIVIERGHGGIVRRKLKTRRITHLRDTQSAVKQTQNRAMTKSQKCRTELPRILIHHPRSLRRIITHLSEKLGTGSDYLRSCKEERQWKARAQAGIGKKGKWKVNLGLWQGE